MQDLIVDNDISKVNEINLSELKPQISKIQLAMNHFSEGIRLFSQSLIEWSNTCLLPAFKKIAKSFSDSLYEHMKNEYLKNHRRLPGSDRTSRLRKKRKSKIMAWYLDESKELNRLN